MGGVAVIVFCAHTVALAKVDELSQQLQEMNMKFDELHNKMKSKDEKILTLEKSISTVKERCAAKLKVCSIRVVLYCIREDFYGQPSDCLSISIGYGTSAIVLPQQKSFLQSQKLS